MSSIIYDESSVAHIAVQDILETNDPANKLTQFDIIADVAAAGNHMLDWSTPPISPRSATLVSRSTACKSRVAS